MLKMHSLRLYFNVYVFIGIKQQAVILNYGTSVSQDIS